MGGGGVNGLTVLSKRGGGLRGGGRVFKLGLKVHKIEIFFGFDFEIFIISLLVMSNY